MIDDELGKNLKKSPVVEYEIPKKIFTRSDDQDATPGTILARLWASS